MIKDESNKKVIVNWAHINFKDVKSAILAILATDGFKYNGNTLNVSFGLTKYCWYFLKDQRCKHKYCSYFHQIAPKEDIFDKHSKDKKTILKKVP